ncbi:S1 family peptidase [Nonomuraea sp. NPDC005983]|uniref:S1 family peptidase n=1 Tax=Nonomuraea sp. NPDC005983 TaxID=3155595 RepID=UPI0033AF01CD
MPPRKTATASTALAVTLLATPALAPTARSATAPAGSLYAAARERAAASADPPAGLVEALSRDLQISDDQAGVRLLNETAAADVEPQLRALLGPTYGGAWVTGPTSTMIAATTDRNQVPAITRAGVQARVVSRSLQQLNRVKAALDRASATAPRTAPIWYVDLPGNRVVVLSSTPTTARAWVDAVGVSTSAVEVVRSDEKPALFYDVRGGDGYYIDSRARCSIGFAVTKAGSPGGFVSAGHCGSEGATTAGTDWVPQGTFRGSSFPGNDYSWVEVGTNWTPLGEVDAYSAGMLPVRGSTAALVGSSVCRSGSTTHYHCGTVQQVDTSVTYSQGTVYEATRTDVCAEPGDSGGSFISGDQAQGVTSGGAGNCTKGGITYFQPVNEILTTYGLTLATAPAPPASNL